MSNILFIKTSSLGDVIHHMPAVTEARRHFPDAHIAWVVEEGFAPLVALHPAVDEVIAVASRRWRRVPALPSTWREIGRFLQAVRATSYDTVIDSQGLFRSAVIARIARGRRHGYDTASVRERAAAWLYDVHHRVDRSLHAVVRNRALTGLALGYVPEGPPDYGLAPLRRADQIGRTAVLLHGTARAEKEWRPESWRTVAEALANRGYELVLPSGSEAESTRGSRIARGLPGVRMLDRQPLDSVARAIAGAAIVVGVDTGLLHLGAALGVPLVAIFVGASDPRLTGPLGSGPMEVLGADGKAPTAPEVLAAVELLQPSPG